MKRWAVLAPVLGLLCACGTAPQAAFSQTALTPMTPAEASYVEQTASVIYRRAPVERLDGLLFSDARGHGTCVRSPAGAVEEADYTLLVLQRRIAEDFIPQAADDVLILRSREEAAPCRALGRNAYLWIRGL